MYLDVVSDFGSGIWDREWMSLSYSYSVSLSLSLVYDHPLYDGDIMML